MVYPCCNLNPSLRSYVAIGCIACATLIYQVAITRILSVVLWYHFAFLSISLAMLGLGAPGVWFALRPPGRAALAWAMRAAAIAVPLSIIVIFRFGDDFDRGKGTVAGLGTMFPPGVLLISAAILVTAIALGSAVCLLLMEARGREVGRVYGADLIGATIGALTVVPLMWIVPTPMLIVGCGFLPLVADAVLGRSRRWVSAALALTLLGTIVWGEPYVLRYAKDYKEDASRILWERWTPTAKLTIWNQPFQGNRVFGWGFGKQYDQNVTLSQYWLEQDGSAGTPITKLEGEPASLPHLFWDVTAVGYELRPPKTVCVIGGGGGRDILMALAAGATDIDAVELNAAIIDVLSDEFREFSGNVYHRPGVHAIASEGRSYLTRTKNRYDLLQISLIDSWAATAAGAFALSENHLYTLEAMQLYFHRLSPTGMLSISRWNGGRRYLEAARLALLARAALAAEGIADPDRHMVIIRGGWVSNLLMSREPFSEATLVKARELLATRGYTFDWPATPQESPVARVLIEGAGFLSKHGVDLSPPTDDRPFFFQNVSLFGSVDSKIAPNLSPNEHSVLLLRRLIVIIGIATIALFFAPFALSRRRRGAAGFWRGSAYFASIGLGFMLVEAGWIQRFILFLGHPSYATTVVIAALLLGAGSGSFVAAKVPLARVQRWAPVLAVLLSGLNLMLDPLLQGALGLAFPLRVAIALLMLVPPGFLMGFAFPSGMTRFGDTDKPWFWAVNGAAGVLASVCSLGLAMMLGFEHVVLIGAVLYLAAALLLRGTEAPPAAV